MFTESQTPTDDTNKNFEQLFHAAMEEVLDERLKRIIILYYGMNGEKPHNLAEIGRIFNLSRERIRQLFVKSLKKNVPLPLTR